MNGESVYIERRERKGEVKREEYKGTCECRVFTGEGGKGSMCPQINTRPLNFSFAPSP